MNIFGDSLESSRPLVVLGYVPLLFCFEYNSCYLCLIPITYHILRIGHELRFFSLKSMSSGMRLQ